MVKSIRVLVLIICIPLIAFSQQWQQYSDSVLVNLKNNNVNNAIYFIGLADNILAKSTLVKDTVYADYLYRKGVVKVSLGEFDSCLLKESLSIWESSPAKNPLKIMKICYFLGNNYYELGNLYLQSGTYSLSKIVLKQSHEYYEKCYSLIKKYDLQTQSNYTGVLYALTLIDYISNKDYEKAKMFAAEYIEYIKVIGLKDFDFDYINALKFSQDNIVQEQVLLEYLSKYQNQKLNDPKLLFRIYFELFYNKLFVDNKINNKKNPLEVIKYGEKALELWGNVEIEAKSEIENIYSMLSISYGEIGDNLNRNKYDSLYKNLIGNDDEIDSYTELDNLYRAEDYSNFKIKFDTYETDLKNKKDYDELLQIYIFSLTLFERSILFNKEDIAYQLELINNNRKLLNDENKVYLDLALSEFYAFTNQLNNALDICNQNLNTDDIASKLKFYKIKSACEFTLGDIEKSTKTAYKTLDIAIDFYGDNDPRLLPFLNAVLAADLMGINPNSTKIATKALKILYENKLEQTDIAVNTWQSLGNQASAKYNYKDALIYFEKSKSILETSKTINNDWYYLSCLVSLAEIYTVQNNLDKAKVYLEKAKKYLEAKSNIFQLAYESYYYAMGNYYFQQDQFRIAKGYYEKSFSFYNTDKISTKKIRYFICEYFLENNATKLVESIEKHQKENNDSFWGWGLLYLIKYNSGDVIGAKNILIDQLNKLITDNNQYYQLLSYDEKEILYKHFSNQFEYLNTYLLNKDGKFLVQYINFRFYSKSLLFSTSYKSSIADEKNKELYAELKNNTSQIDKAIESKPEDLKVIGDLKNKNREIEKFLSANTKPLPVPTLKDLNNKLKQDEAYVEIIRINKQSQNDPNNGKEIIKFFTDSIAYGAIIIKKDKDPKFILIDSSNKLENLYSVYLKNQIQNKQLDTISYHFLFEKIDNELNGIKKIYLVTDGSYNSINVESIYNPLKRKYVIDYLKIQQIQNIRSITEDKPAFKITSSTKASLFGNPDFNLEIKESNIPEYIAISNLDSTLFSEVRGSTNITRLEGTEKEISTINSILKSAKCSVDLYSGDLATEDNLKKVQSPGILHIATHGYFLKDDDASKTKLSISDLFNDNYANDSFLKSGLLLAGAQNTLNGKQIDGSDNGILTAEEAKSLDLKDTKLVVLSACETGLGDDLIGEGVIGLPRAFMIAGAECVIMSLWSVSDEKTQQLMTLFYTNWIKNNISKEDAFYQAKIEIQKLYPHPYYWAGFVLLK